MNTSDITCAGMVRLCALVVLVASPSLAADTLFLGDDWRYQHTSNVGLWAKGVVQRSFADMLAIPASTGTWSAADVLTLMLTASLTVGATVPVNGRSLDARIQDELHRARGPNCDYSVRESIFCRPPAPSGFRVWNDVSNVIIIGTAITTPLALLLGGALGGNRELVEAGTLAIEAFSVAQMYHVGIKLLVGREGPLWHDGAGEAHGPSAAYFPDGWPSGHAATLFSIATVYATYFDKPWLRVLLLGLAAGVATMLVVDDAHYASDVVLGAAIGFFTGRWVVHHRSSRYSYGPRGLPVRLMTVAPLAVDHGVGVAARFSF